MKYDDLVGKWIEVHTKAAVNPLYVGQLKQIPLKDSDYLELANSYNPGQLSQTILDAYETSSFFDKITGLSESPQIMTDTRKMRRVFGGCGQITRINLDDVLAVTVQKD